MAVEYRLISDGGKYQRLECSGCNSVIVKDLTIFGFGDVVSFEKENEDGSTYGSNFGLKNIGCFVELRPYERLMDVPQGDLRKLAGRIYQLLFMRPSLDDEIYGVEPEINEKDWRYQQIVKELDALQEIERRLVNSGEIVFPEISEEEIAWQDLW